MLNIGDETYNGFTYRVSATGMPGKQIQGEVSVARNDPSGKPAGNCQTIIVEGEFGNDDEAMKEARNRIKAMIDGTTPGLDV